MNKIFDTIESISESISSGITPLRSNPEYWTDGVIPWLKTEQLGEFEITITSERISEKALEETSIKINPANTVSIALYGEGRTRGNVSILKEPMTTNQACCNIVVDDQVADFRYVYYWLKNNYHQLRNLSSGVRKNLSADEIKSFPFNYREPIEQTKIATILSTLDEKISLNNRINTELEQMSKTIYNYWFVQFDFPNEQGKPYKASGGEMEYNEELKREIPVGWEVDKMNNIVEVKDGTHDSPKQSKEGFHLITSKHLTKAGIDFASAYLISESDYNSVNKRSKVDTGDILISMIGTIGLLYFVQDKEINFAIKNIGLFKTSQDKSYTEYLYLSIQSVLGEQYFTSNKSGSIQKYLSLDVLRTIPLLKPEKSVLNFFREIVNPIMQLIHSNNLENQELITLRDFLLPLLMNGQVKVK